MKKILTILTIFIIALIPICFVGCNNIDNQEMIIEKKDNIVGIWVLYQFDNNGEVLNLGDEYDSEIITENFYRITVYDDFNFILKSEQSNEEYMICGYIIKIDENKYEMTIEDEIIDLKIENNLLYLTDEEITLVFNKI